MKAVRDIFISTLSSLTVGGLAILPVVTSENGYVGGFVFLPMLILVFVVAGFLFLSGVVLAIASKKVGLYLLLSSILLPVGFFAGATISQYFEIGAYRVEPMIPF